MGKKSKRQRPGKAASAKSRRAAIQARHQVARIDAAAEADRVADPPSTLEELREKADLQKIVFMTLMKETPKELQTANCFYQFRSYCGFLMDGSKQDVTFSTEKDHQFLKAMSKSATELSIFRAGAYWTRAMLWCDNFDKEYAVQCLQKTMHVCETAGKKERQESSPFLDNFHEESQRRMNSWRSIPLVSIDTETGAVLPASVSPIGGDQCDACGKTLEQLGVSMLDCCSLCQWTYYCSRDCQMGHWKQHKQMCRKPGELRAGDTAVYGGPDGVFPWADLVQLISRAPDNSLRWVVSQKFGATKTSTVDTKHLRRCRPALWNCAKKKKTG